MREGGRIYVGDGESNGGREEGTKVDELPKGTEQRWCETKISSSRNNIFIPAEAIVTGIDFCHHNFYSNRKSYC